MNKITEDVQLFYIFYLEQYPERRIRPFDELFEEYDFFVTGWCIHKKQILTHEVDVRGFRYQNLRMLDEKNVKAYTKSRPTFDYCINCKNVIIPGEMISIKDPMGRQPGNSDVSATVCILYDMKDTYGNNITAVYNSTFRGKQIERIFVYYWLPKATKVPDWKLCVMQDKRNVFLGDIEEWLARMYNQLHLSGDRDNVKMFYSSD
jgi:hypothetical protein